MQAHCKVADPPRTSHHHADGLRENDVSIVPSEGIRIHQRDKYLGDSPQNSGERPETGAISPGYRRAAGELPR